MPKLFTFAVLSVLFLAASPAFAQLRTQDAQTILTLTNAARQTNGKPALQTNAVLTQAAQQHALNMAKQEKMEHELDGKKFDERIKAAGYNGSSYGENIGMQWGDGDLNQSMIDGWMASPTHHDNMLSISEPFTEIGIGVAVSPSGKIYYCQDFGKP